jgi:hypothetical protein
MKTPAIPNFNSPRFVVASNPVAPDGRLYIVHLGDPLIIAEAFHFEQSQEADWMECKSNFVIGSSVDFPGKLIVLGAIYCAPTELKAEELAKIMSQMGDWYHTYLKWLAENDGPRK